MSEVAEGLLLCDLFDLKRKLTLQVVIRILCGVGDEELVVFLNIQLFKEIWLWSDKNIQSALSLEVLVLRCDLQKVAVSLEGATILSRSCVI